MANIMRRREHEQSIPARSTWDPFRMMRDLLHFDPFAEGAGWPSAYQAMDFSPTFEVKETKDAYVFKADLPGIKEEDLDINLTGNRLTISGKREAAERDQGDTFYAYERSYGAFTRAFTLPEGADAEHVQAELKDGVLNLILPKKPEVQPKKILLKPAEKAKAKS